MKISYQFLSSRSEEKRREERTHEIVTRSFNFVDGRVTFLHNVERFRTSEDTSNGIDTESEHFGVRFSQSSRKTTDRSSSSSSCDEEIDLAG